MARRRTNNFGRKPGFFEKLKMGTAHPQYDPNVEGYGNASEWAATFNVRMGFKEASEYKAKRGWGDDWKQLGDLAGVHINKDSMWSEVKKAFWKAAKANHPDTHPGDAAAEERFKTASAAYAMLENIYTMEGRID